MKIFQKYLPIIILTIILCPLSSFSEPPPFWNSPQQLSLGQAVSAEIDACSFENNIYVVWSDDRTGNKEIFFRSSNDAGNTWNREERITKTIAESDQPVIACDNKNVYVVWREKNKELSQIYYKIWDGSVWGNDIILFNEHKNAKNPDISTTTIMPNSYLYIVWQNMDSNGKTISYLTRSIDRGKTFSMPDALTEGKWETKEPTVWCGARDAYVAWADNREMTWNIFFRRWGEAQKGLEAKLSSFSDCSFPSIGGMEPYIYVTWQCIRNNYVYNDVYASYSINNGNEWTKAKQLTYSRAEAVLSKVIVSRDVKQNSFEQSWFFWQDGRNGDWQIFYSNIDLDGTISNADLLIDSDKPSVMNDAITTNGQVHLFWTRIESPSHSAIFYARRDMIPPDQPGIPSHFDLTANLGYDDDKNITFNWKPSSNSGKVIYNIYFSDGDNFKLAGSTEKTTYNLNGENGKIYRIYVRAIDEVGNISPPSEISQKILCDLNPPEIAIHSPQTNSNILGNIPIIISVKDTNLLEAKIEYGVNAFPSSWENLTGPLRNELDHEQIMIWNMQNLEGIYSIRLIASDKAGNESKVEAKINIDTKPPIAISFGEMTQLTPIDQNWHYGDPAWSPSGDKIVFYSDESGSEDLWTMSLDRKNRTRLTRNTDIERSPDWSQNMLVYQSIPANEQPFNQEKWKIWVINSDGKNAKQITFGEGSDMNPSWAPDGSMIAYDSNVDGDSEIWLITNMNRVLAGEKPQLRKLTDNKWDDRNPSWSPDGSMLAYQSNGKGTWDIYIMDINGANSQPIIATDHDEIAPSWSPDRKWIIYSTNQFNDHYEIRGIDWQKKTNIVVLSHNDIDAHNVRWSPQKNLIAYEANGSLYISTIINPIGDLEAIITSPKDGDMVSEKLDIKGIARGKNFSNYILQYFDQKTSAYKTIGGISTSQVTENGFLGRWNTDELEGQYLLRLVVTGKNDEYVEDSVWVTISNHQPFIFLDEPINDLVTMNPFLDVKGRTEPNSIVTLDGTPIKLNSDGSFVRKIQLSDGVNQITIKAKNNLSQAKEFTVQRTVTLDSQPPKLNIESPLDFQVVNVPYILIKGKLDEKAEVSILSSRVWADDNGNFQRKISLNEGDNIITIVASDSIGQYSSIQRRVIYEKKSEVISDSNPPAIVDVYPDSNAVFTGKSLEISAKLIDDIGIDPSSIKFMLNNMEIERKDYKLDIGMLDVDKVVKIDEYPIINFSYKPIQKISEGSHNFTIHIEDTSGNIADSSFSFSIDNSPSKAIVSAFLDDNLSKIRIVVVSNKRLEKIQSLSVTPKGDYGYSISNLTKKDGFYEAFLDISSSQKSFLIDFSARTYLNKIIEAQGYLSWNTFRSGEIIDIGKSNSARFISEPINIRNGKLNVILRSQDGLDLNVLDTYNSDAEYRKLGLSSLIYILATSPEIDEENIKGVLSLPIIDQSGINKNKLVMFKWNDAQKQWQALGKLGMSNSLLSSKITGAGTYALFADDDPPAISDVFPTDAKEVPLDRFFVEAKIKDIGSGVADIKVMVDSIQVSHDYDPINGILTYFPSELDWGLHKIRIIAIDIAGNISEFSSDFVTQETFQFISSLAYPNPVRDKINIEFRLTKSADVTLKVYTINGELIYETTKNSIAKGEFIWKLRNKSGNKVSSGIYIYTLEAQIYKTKIHRHGKIAILK